MSVETHRTAREATVKGRAEDVLKSVESQDSAVSHLILGLVMAMNKMDQDVLTLDLNGDDPSDKILELRVKFDESGSTCGIETRFLPSPEETDNG